MKVKEWIASITKEKSIEEKIEDSKLKKNHKVCFVVALILLICINVFQLYDGALSDDAKYMNIILRDSKENFISRNTDIVNAELVFDSVQTSIIDSKIPVAYATLVDRLCVAIWNIANSNEYEPIIMPEYNGNNESIKQFLSDANKFNEIIDQLYQLQKIENQRELTEEEMQITKDIKAKMDEINELVIEQSMESAYKIGTIRIIEIWCILELIGVVYRFFLHQYYYKKFEKEQLN